MGRFWRNFLCISIAIVFAVFGNEIVFIFWPLIFPQRLDGSSRGDDALPFVVVMFFLSFGAIGLLLSRRLTRKYLRDKNSITVLFR